MLRYVARAHLVLRRLTTRTKRPFDIRGYRHAPATTTVVAKAKDGHLDGGINRNAKCQLADDAVVIMLEGRHARSMPDAVRCAINASEPGAAILLSPAAASFGAFRDYEDRGNQFRDAVDVLCSAADGSPAS